MPALMPRNPHRNAPEYADRVNLIKKIKIGKIWTFAPVVAEANGRLTDTVRVSGGKRDDLQAAIALIRKDLPEQPLSFNNFRD